MAFDRQAISSNEIWRLWTAHSDHFSVQHALADALAFFLLGAFVEKETGSWRLAIGLALAAPCMSLGLLSGTADLLYYRGASGIAMMMAILAGASIWMSNPSSRSILIVLMLGLVIKTAYEAFGNSMGLLRLPPDIAVAWQAHVFGAICGWSMAFIGALTRNASRRQSV